MNRHEIGNRLLNIRNEKGLSRAEVASKADIGTTTLQQWETGSREASIETLGKLAQLYKVSPQWLIFGLDDSTAQAPAVDPVTGVSVEQAIDTLKNLIEDSQPKLTEEEAFLLKEFRALDPDQKRLMLRFLVAGFDGLNNTNNKGVFNSPNTKVSNSFTG